MCHPDQAARGEPAAQSRACHSERRRARRLPLSPLAAAEFAAALDPLGPFEPQPRLAVAVSGGADSMALALLAAEWAQARGGEAVAMIVDHRLRAGSGPEAQEAAARLAGCGINAQILALDLPPGPGISVRARDARHEALQAACRGRGIVHLLFGHHANDQAETVVMRTMAGSHRQGRAGMAALAETGAVRLLRPLLLVPPGRLRASLRARGVGWCEDPTNADARFLRARLRAYRGDPQGTSPATRATAQAARDHGVSRIVAEREAGTWLSTHATLHPAGYATIPAGPLPQAALRSLLRTIAGAERPPRSGVAELARAPRAATLGGVRILPAGRLRPEGWLLVREPRSMDPPVAAMPGAVWDGRFRLASTGKAPEGATLGALGAGLPGRDLPAALRQTLPALWTNGKLFAVPHLGYPDPVTCDCIKLVFAPGSPVACAPFGVSPDVWAGDAVWGCSMAGATLC